MTDKPDSKRIEAQESTRTSEKVGHDGVIGDNTGQKTWGTASDIAHQNDQHPSEVQGVKAISSFGIDFGNGAVLTAKGLEGDNQKEYEEVSSKDSSLPPPVSRKRMMEIAQHEKSHPTKWQSIVGKCNQFLDKVASDAGMRLPWKPGNPPRSGGLGGMREKLDKSPDFEKVWKTDFDNLEGSLEKFMHFQMQPGDLVIWDVPKSAAPPDGLSHGAIASGAREIIYAGSKEKGGNGCGQCPIKYFSGEPGKRLNYGAPTAIYRYKNMTK